MKISSFPFFLWYQFRGILKRRRGTTRNSSILTVLDVVNVTGLYTLFFFHFLYFFPACLFIPFWPWILFILSELSEMVNFLWIRKEHGNGERVYLYHVTKKLSFRFFFLFFSTSISFIFLWINKKKKKKNTEKWCKVLTFCHFQFNFLVFVWTEIACRN